jgi:uncharacterized membrane protein YesL
VRAPKTFWKAIIDLYDDLMLLAGASIVWWLGVLLIVPGPPATAGLYYLAHRIVHEQRVELGFFWQEARKRLGQSWGLAGVNLLALAILVVNFVFYAGIQNFLRYIALAWVYLFLLWLALQFHLFPLLFEMENPRLGLLLRNAALLALMRPGYTLFLLVLAFLATILCIVLPFLLLAIWPALMALLGARATLTAIEVVAERQAAREAE